MIGARCARAVVACLASVIASIAASSAHAQSRDVSHGVEQYADADYEGATRTLEAALAGDGLSRVEAGRALATIAAASFAIGDTERMSAAIAQLAVIEPDHEFGADVPPNVSDALRDARAHAVPVTVRIDVAPSGARRHVSASVTTGVDGLVREVVLACTGARERENVGARPELDVDGRATCAARAVGPGGVVLARTAVQLGASAASDADDAADVAVGPERPPATHGEPPWLWIGLGVGAALLVALVIVIAVAAPGGDSSSFEPVPAIHW